MNWGKIHTNINNEVMNLLWMCACVCVCMCACGPVNWQIFLRNLHTYILFMENLFKMSVLQKRLAFVICKTQENKQPRNLYSTNTCPSALSEKTYVFLSVCLTRKVHTQSTYTQPWIQCIHTNPESRACYLPCLLDKHRQGPLAAQSLRDLCFSGYSWWFSQ